MAEEESVNYLYDNLSSKLMEVTTCQLKKKQKGYGQNFIMKK